MNLIIILKKWIEILINLVLIAEIKIIYLFFNQQNIKIYNFIFIF